MPQRISISRWNIGETSQRAIGDYDQPIWAATCRLLTNFVPSETGKLWRRPGFLHHITLTEPELQSGQLRLIPYYRNQDTLLLLFYLEWVDPNWNLNFRVYEQDADGIYQFDSEYAAYAFSPTDLSGERPDTVDLKKLSWVQIDNSIILTHENMQDPRRIIYDLDTPIDFEVRNYPADDCFYYDVIYNITDNVWDRQPLPLTEGGGTSLPNPPGDPAGWTPYTGREFDPGTPATPNNLKASPQVFKYLTGVNFGFERLLFTGGSRVFGSAVDDPTLIGRQDNGDTDTTAIETEAVKIIPSDPFFYRAASDLGYEKFYWLCIGSMVMGGANNGAWVLSNRELGGMDPTSPLMYKATTHGAHWVQGKTIGDSMLYFQRPGRLLKEFLFANASKNYVAMNMSEYSDHLFYDAVPIEAQVQRSPFNVMWILREDGTLVSFTYERQREMYAWARHPFGIELSANDTDVSARSEHIQSLENDTAGNVETMAIVSDGVYDQVAVITNRENASGAYRAIEVMGRYTPEELTVPFVDSAVNKGLDGDWKILSLTESTGDGHKLNYSLSATGTHPTLGMQLGFIDASRTDDEVRPISEGRYDYIYGDWFVSEVNTTEFWFKMESQNGIPYEGIWESAPPETEYAYYDFGSARETAKQPAPGDTQFLHLSGVFCESMMDGSPRSIYVSQDGLSFYDSDLIPRDWDGDESSLVPEQLNNDSWHTIIIGRSYDSVFTPFVMKKSLNRGKINSIELEVFRSLGGKVGTANVGYDNKLDVIKAYDATYPALVEENELYTGTIKPAIVGGYGVDPFFFVLVSSAVPFNLTNTIFTLEAT